jgi:propanol-preferring alcohol dehydrogenase
MKTAARQSRVTIVGIGNLSPYEWAFLTTAYETELVNTYWGTVEELHEVVDMFKAGQIEPQYTTYSLDEALDAYQLLVDGKIAGRAIIVPHGEK